MFQNGDTKDSMPDTREAEGQSGILHAAITESPENLERLLDTIGLTEDVRAELQGEREREE